VPGDFRLQIFYESISPKPLSIPLRPFRIFRKFAEIFAAQGALMVSTTPVVPVAKFAAGVLIPVVHLELRISPRIFEKILNGTTGVVSTGSAPSLVNISANFRKKS
jgi:hypothetical protein